MNNVLNVLIVDDSKDDVLLIERELHRAGMLFQSYVVKCQKSFSEALTAFKPQVILCDHSLPLFNSVEALNIFKSHYSATDVLIPFILVTGNVSEDFAIHAMKAGVDDYILKDRLKRLPVAIEGALEKCRALNEKARHMRQIIAREALMSEAEKLANFGSWQQDLNTGEQIWSDASYAIYGFEPGEVTPTYDLFLRLIHPDDRARTQRIAEGFLVSGNGGEYQFRIINNRGDLRYLSCRMHVYRDDAGKPVKLVGFNLDVTDSKQAAVALEKRSQEYRSLFDQNPDAVFSLDVSGSLTNINQGVSLLTGASPEELIGMHFRQFMHPEDVARVKGHFHDCLQKSPQRFEARYRYGASNTLTFDITFIPIVVDDEVIGVHGIGKDITRKKQLEEQLETAYRQSHIGTWEYDVASGKISWSRITRELHEVGGDYEPSLEQALLFIKDDEHRSSTVTALNQALRSPEKWDIEVRLLTAQGNERWVRSRGAGEFHNGKCVRLFGTLQDIHDRKVAELTLRAANEEKARILESIADGFVTVNRSWTVTRWNRPAQELTKIRRQDIVGKNLWEFFAGSIEMEFYEHSRRAMEEQVVTEFETPFSALNLRLQTIIYPSAEGLSIYFKDITGNGHRSAVVID